ncbi:hypothetical protein L6164_003913 [Bauhinia variegata]|uniref:Uncharacterized protein n=1 Tax=Bauhinia variegata TaxID=167791 RepID=A0ACB9Q1W4_BAUVA|nr:hypothetical protein L6164_003913 [Bauhinia variegata]
MRIRKNGKLCHLLLSNGASVPLEAFQSHVCQLNQSPWDVIPFASDSPQFEGEDSFTGNDSPADSIGAVESVASMMDSGDKSLPKIEDMVVDDGNDIGQKKAKAEDDNGDREEQNGIAFDKGEEKPSHCQKTDGKGWQCKNQAKDGQSFCEHHLSLLRSYNSGSYNNNNPSKKAVVAAAAAAAAGVRRARARAAKKSTSSNPYEFYYYSGFGPLWGKRRGDRNGEGTKNESKILENSTITDTKATAATNVSPSATASTPSSSSQIEHEGFDYVDDDEEDDTNGDSSKKRMRKPVKARSLKSLM